MAMWDLAFAAQNTEIARGKPFLRVKTEKPYRDLLSYCAGEGDGLTKDADCVHFFAPEDQGAVLGVFRLQGDMVSEEPDALEGGFVVDKDGGDLAGLHGILLADIDDVAVKDPGVDHGVTLTGEGKVCVDVIRGVNIVLDVLLGQNGCTAGNGANQGELLHSGEGDDVFGINLRFI